MTCYRRFLQGIQRNCAAYLAWIEGIGRRFDEQVAHWHRRITDTVQQTITKGKGTE